MQTLGPLLKNGLPLIGNVLKPLPKSVLILFGLTAAASATETVIQKKIYGSETATLIISNEEMNDIMKIVKSFEELGLLLKGDSKRLKMKPKNKNEDFQ